jgi:hypothetical protein
MQPYNSIFWRKKGCVELNAYFLNDLPNTPAIIILPVVIGSSIQHVSIKDEAGREGVGLLRGTSSLPSGCALVVQRSN